MMTTPVCIVGAGPGGAATALRLSYLNIPCILLDKAIFPRDKICGDAISGKVTTLLNRLDPAIMQRFNGVPVQTDIWGIRFFPPNTRPVDIPFAAGTSRQPDAAPGYVSKRWDFDHFLVQEARARPNVQFLSGVEITQFKALSSGFQLSDQSGQIQIHCQLLIDAAGAYSRFSRKHAGLTRDPAHHASAVRAYYQGVSGMSAQNYIELHFLKEITPGYFWIFPLPNGWANVGLGLRSDFLKKRQVNLRQALDDIIQNHPEIAPRFAGAQPMSPTVGYGLPLGSKTRKLSGDHYLLVGDAGHLIDPFTGEGIGNAVYSGFIAAELAEKALAAQDFSAQFLKAYDVRVARVLGAEMKLSYRMQQIGRHPWLLNGVGTIITSNRKVIDYFTAMMVDFNLREQLVNPWFWLKLWLRR